MSGACFGLFSQDAAFIWNAFDLSYCPLSFCLLGVGGGGHRAVWSVAQQSDSLPLFAFFLFQYINR